MNWSGNNTGNGGASESRRDSALNTKKKNTQIYICGRSSQINFSKTFLSPFPFSSPQQFLVFSKSPRNSPPQPHADDIQSHLSRAFVLPHAIQTHDVCEIDFRGYATFLFFSLTSSSGFLAVQKPARLVCSLRIGETFVLKIFFDLRTKPKRALPPDTQSSRISCISPIERIGGGIRSCSLKDKRMRSCRLLSLFFSLTSSLWLYSLFFSLTSSLWLYSLFFSLTSSLWSYALFFSLTSSLCLYALLFSRLFARTSRHQPCVRFQIDRILKPIAAFSWSSG